jgi:hypothetical protein
MKGKNVHALEGDMAERAPGLFFAGLRPLAEMFNAGGVGFPRAHAPRKAWGVFWDGAVLAPTQPSEPTTTKKSFGVILGRTFDITYLGVPRVGVALYLSREGGGRAICSSCLLEVQSTSALSDTDFV